jgi:hypothetical protein
VTAPLEHLDDKPDSYEELVDDFQNKLAARLDATLERLRALENELEEIQIDLETGP